MTADLSIDLGEDFAEQIAALALSEQVTIAATLADVVVFRFPAEKRRQVALMIAETLLANVEGRGARL